MDLCFAEQLKQFSKSVDFITDDQFKRIAEIISEYLQGKLKVCLIELLEESVVNSTKPALKIDWSNVQPPGDNRITIHDENDNINGQTSYGYLTNYPMWIVAENSNTALTKASTYVDKWSNQNNIPKYICLNNYNNPKTKTSIIIPITTTDKKKIILNFESTEHLHFSERAEKDLKAIADVLINLRKLSRMWEQSTENTKTAIKMLQVSAQNCNAVLNGLPQLFLAYSDRAEDDILFIIKSILNEKKYEQLFKVFDWKKNRQPKDIMNRIIHEIAQSSYGLCYLSEPYDSETTIQNKKYKDNMNVIYEMGMFKSSSYIRKNIQCLAIREKGTSLPFDIEHENILLVDRDQNGKIIIESFEKKFREMLDELIITDCGECFLNFKLY